MPDDFFFNIFLILCVGVWGGMGNVVSTVIVCKTNAIIFFLKKYKRNKREKKEVKVS